MRNRRSELPLAPHGAPAGHEMRRGARLVSTFELPSGAESFSLVTVASQGCGANPGQIQRDS